MQLLRKAPLASALFLLGLLGGACSHDPAARKQRYFESGMHYFQQGRYAEAAIQFQNAIQIDPGLVNAHYELAQCFLREQRWPEAFRELSTTVNLEPRNWPAQLDMANFFFQARQFQNAKDRAALILKENDNDVKARMLMATADGELGNLTEAIDEAKQAAQLASQQPAPYLTLGLLQEKAGQPAAEQNLQKAVALDPKFLPGRLGLGSFYQKRRQWADAETEYRAAVEAERGNPLSWSSLASLYAAWGKKDLAEQTLQEAKNAMPNEPAGYRLLGEFYVANGDAEKALAEFASLHREHANDLYAEKRYIQLLVQAKQFEQASALAEEILKQNSKDPEALLARGQILNLQQRPADAVPVLEIAVRSDAENPAGHFQLGNSYYATGNLVGAEREWREALRLGPSMVEAAEKLAILALRTGDAILLEQTANQWLKSARSSPEAYLMRGTARLKKGDAQGAEADLKETIALAPQSATAYTRLGDLRLAQKRFGEAEKLYEQALTIDPRAADALRGLTGLFLLQRQPDRAVRRAQAQIAAVPDKSDYYFLLGEALLAAHKNAEARNALEQAMQLDQTDLTVALVLGQAQEATGDPSAAAATYERAIQVNPKDVRSYISLGALEERRANWQRAEQLYRKALQIQPDQSAAANNLSYLLLEHGGDVNYALSLAQMARHGMPDSPNAADTLAWAYYKMGVYDSAIGLLQEATKKVPQNPAYFYHLGLASQKANKTLLAKASLQRALQLDPKSPWVEQIRQALAQLDSAE